MRRDTSGRWLRLLGEVAHPDAPAGARANGFIALLIAALAARGAVVVNVVSLP
jgi:hypothetical protein